MYGLCFCQTEILPFLKANISFNLVCKELKISRTITFHKLIKHLDLVVQKMDNAIQWINHYPVDSVVCFANSYSLDRDVSSG